MYIIATDNDRNTYIYDENDDHVYLITARDFKKIKFDNNNQIVLAICILVSFGLLFYTIYLGEHNIISPLFFHLIVIIVSIIVFWLLIKMDYKQEVEEFVSANRNSLETGSQLRDEAKRKSLKNIVFIFLYEALIIFFYFYLGKTYFFSAYTILFSAFMLYLLKERLCGYIKMHKRFDVQDR